MKFLNMFRNKANEDAAQKLYSALVGQSRQSVFYTDIGVPDTKEGRFDMIAIHAFLIMRRLKQDHSRTAELSQNLFDIMFKDMEFNLREMGVSDIVIGKRVKKLVKAFYGRIDSYEKGLGGGDDILAGALERNLFRDAEPEHIDVPGMISYMRCEAGAMDGQELESLMAGDVTFGAAPGKGGAGGKT